jgi:hypothetical protein
MNITELFWNTSLKELKRGYIETEKECICLLCGAKIEKGIIYPKDGVLYEARRYTEVHIETAHQSVFEYLIHLDKRLTGLTDHQNSLLQLFYQGKSDVEIQQEMSIGSASTIRNHRFVLKEKERQARVFLTIMELLKEKDQHAPNFISLHKTATVVDERYNVTREESEKILKKYFPDGPEGPLATFSMKEKSKLVVLREIAGRFEAGRMYDEKEVNELLKTIYEVDYVTLRRYLIEYGFLDRKPDGSRYWLKSNLAKNEPQPQNRWTELKRQYKETSPEAGVYQIKNLKNGKILVESTMNLKTINGRRLELQRGIHRNQLLQKEIEEFGPEAFVFEVLEVLKTKDTEDFDTQEALKRLAGKWLEKLKPYGERGYNQSNKGKEDG